MGSGMMSGLTKHVRKRFRAMGRFMKNLPMRFHGKVYQDGKFWLAKVPVLDTITQGRTCKEALAMVKDLLEILANPPRVYGGGTPRAAWGVGGELCGYAEPDQLVAATATRAE